MKVKTKARTFETAYRSLEGLVHEIESRTLGLEEGITKFEQGLELAQFCKDRLTEAENKVTMIKRKYHDFLDAEAPDDEDGTGRTGVGIDEEDSSDSEEDDEEGSDADDEETV